jgi:nucleoside-diphosphate-sugar epimerase
MLERVDTYKLPNLTSLLSNDDRVLIIGASGWFGQTFTNMMKDFKNKLVISSSKTEKSEPWNIEVVQRFQPTIVANFAFLTRNKLQQYKREEYISINLDLIDRMRFAGQLESVRTLLTVSSGAALSPEARSEWGSKELYGALKRKEEEVALSCQNINKSIVVLRTFSVSGAFVALPSHYAFSSFIEQGLLKREIEVTSRHLVFRRYVSIGDLIAVGLMRGNQGWSGVIESGGELVELGQLAELVGKYLNVHVRKRRLEDNASINSYHSDNLSWEYSCQATKFTPLNLHEQIQSTAAYIKDGLKKNR